VTPSDIDPAEGVGDVEAWHALTAEAALRGLDSRASGLEGPEVQERRARYGLNRLARAETTPAWRILIDQFTSIVVLLLVAAAIVSWAMGERVESLAIAAVLALNAAIGFAVELRARRAMDALLQYEAPESRVRRSGETRIVPAEELVPGDVIELEEGDAVPADARLLSVSGLRVDEAALTGESVRVEKEVEPTDRADAPVADRTCLVFAGTTVVGGRATAVVTHTGSETQIGRIGALLAEVDEGRTPLEARLDALGHRLVWITLGVAALVSVVGVARGADVVLMIETGVALAIAAVPEGLPAVATIALAVGLRRMASRNALVRRLAAVEALGSTTVVCTDKTGTLTAGEMTVTAIVTVEDVMRVTGEGYGAEGSFALESERSEELPGLDGGEIEAVAVLESDRGEPAATRDSIDPASHRVLRRLLETCALTSRAELDGEGGIVGDATDAALLVVAKKAGIDRAALRHEHPQVAEIPFDGTRRLSASIHDWDGVRSILVKGSPGSIIERCVRVAVADGERDRGEEITKRIIEANDVLAQRGLRVIALARGTGEEPESLTYLGMVGILDPPASGVEETIARLRSAGLRTVVITGDQVATAEAVADRVGARTPSDSSLAGPDLATLSDDEMAARASTVGIYSRVDPEQKMRIVEALQANDEIVAMIGDGVNDAAALKKADVGVAMGGRGTDVAKQAADIVLSDDRFVTIGVAVEEGRVIFDNIRKFVFYLFSCNLAEVAVIMCASLVGTPVPLLPLQILWLNLVTDTFPALALALEPPEPGVMDRPPRDPDEAIMSARFVRSMAFYSALITASTLGAFAWGLTSGEPERATTIAFMTLALAQLFHLGNARSRSTVLSPSRMTSNPWALGAVPLVLALQLLAVYWEPLSSVLRTVPLETTDWLVIGSISAAPAVVGQTMRTVRLRSTDRSASP